VQARAQPGIDDDARLPGDLGLVDRETGHGGWAVVEVEGEPEVTAAG